MRWIAVAAIAAGCAAHAGSSEPLPRPVIARGEVPAIPMPAYRGAVRLGACAIELRSASEDERRDRLIAIRSRLPAGARVSLTPLGDRARRVTIAIPAAKKRLKERDARRIARAFVRDAADVFGIEARHARFDGAPPDSDDPTWAIEAEAAPTDPSEWDRGRELRVVMRIDARHGRLDAALSPSWSSRGAGCAGW
jgi:hypothetical protein